MGFSVIYKMISNESGPVESETSGFESEKKSAQDFIAKFNCLNGTAVLRKAQNT